MNTDTPPTAGPADPESDHTLLDRLRAGDDGAAAALYHRYVERLRALARGRCGGDLAPRLDPDDILQSVFRSFFRRVAQGQYEAPEGCELWKLLVVITLNKVRSTAEFHRAAKRDVGATRGGPEALTHVASGPGDGQQLAELRLLVAELLERLPEAQQRVVQLRLEGHEVAEIAARTGRSKRTVERVLQDFRHVLQGKLAEDLK